MKGGEDGGKEAKVKEIIIPLIQIPKDDFTLRTDVVWLFEKVNLEWQNLIFYDDFKGLLSSDSIMNRLGKDRFKVILTDHNVLSRHLRQWEPFVVEIIDHHQDEKKYQWVKGKGEWCHL